MNMGMAEAEMQEKLAELHKKSIHDDGCATMYPGGTCNCTKRAIRTGMEYPTIGLFDIRNDNTDNIKTKKGWVRSLFKWM